MYYRVDHSWVNRRDCRRSTNWCTIWMTVFNMDRKRLILLSIRYGNFNTVMHGVLWLSHTISGKVGIGEFKLSCFKVHVVTKTLVFLCWARVADTAFRWIDGNQIHFESCWRTWACEEVLSRSSFRDLTRINKLCVSTIVENNLEHFRSSWWVVSLEVCDNFQDIVLAIIVEVSIVDEQLWSIWPIFFTRRVHCWYWLIYVNSLSFPYRNNDLLCTGCSWWRWSKTWIDWVWFLVVIDITVDDIWHDVWVQNNTGIVTLLLNNSYHNLQTAVPFALTIESGDKPQSVYGYPILISCVDREFIEEHIKIEGRIRCCWPMWSIIFLQGKL